MRELLNALLEVQKKIKALKKDEVNPYYKSGYVSLNAVREAVLPALQEHGLVLLQPTEIENNQLVVKTRLIHADTGQEIVSTIPVVTSDFGDAQKVGSGISYARRYAIQALLFLSAEDDDGNSAVNKSFVEKAEGAIITKKPTFNKTKQQTEEL